MATLSEGVGEAIKEMKEKIVAGRIGKRLKEMALMDQAYIKDSTMTVEEMVKQVAGKVGENIQVRRFARFQLGAGGAAAGRGG